MIELHDTFNSHRISRHRTLLAAVRAQRKHLAAVQRANGRGAYLTYGFRLADGTPIAGDAITAARMTLDNP